MHDLGTFRYRVEIDAGIPIALAEAAARDAAADLGEYIKAESNAIAPLREGTMIENSRVEVNGSTAIIGYFNTIYANYQHEGVNFNHPNGRQAKYLVEPVDADKPEGDWYLVEARGVMYGVVRTKLYDRKPDFWGWMTKYFDYAGGGETVRTTLRRGMKGDDVKAMQEKLIRLGYSCGKYGADGDFGADTEAAVERFQENNRLEVDGIYGENTAAAVEKLLKLVDSEPEKDDEQGDPPDGGYTVTGGSVWLWTAPPDCGGSKAKTVHKGDALLAPALGDYKPVAAGGELYWINGKYIKEG